jgi:transcriptional regulator with XRE-family HTH domain
MTIGQRLKALRGDSISTKELDKLAGLTSGTTWMLERSTSDNAQTKTLEPLAVTLGVTLDYLVRGKGPKPTRAQLDKALERARAKHEKNKGKVAREGTHG